MVQYEEHSIFHALADPARCAMIGLLSRRERTLGDLAAPFEMTLQAVRKHLAVLEAAGLVASEKVGRVRMCRLRPQPLRHAARWLKTRADMWNDRLDRLGRILEEDGS